MSATKRLPFVAPLPPATCTACGARPIEGRSDLAGAVAMLALRTSQAEPGALVELTDVEARLILDALRAGVRPVGDHPAEARR